MRERRVQQGREIGHEDPGQGSCRGGFQGFRCCIVTVCFLWDWRWGSATPTGGAFGMDRPRGRAGVPKSERGQQALHVRLTVCRVRGPQSDLREEGCD